MSQLSIVRPLPEVETPSIEKAAPGEATAVGRRKRGVRVNTGLRFYHDVVGLDHLHYGLWNGEPRTLDGLKTAQEGYAEALAAWIPEGVQTVLDVGCGTGATTVVLEGRGFRVDGLAPDPYQEVLFRRRTAAAFHLTRFQEFDPENTYDLVLMSESAQYIWLPDLFASVCRTAAGGWLLVSDYFRLDDDGGGSGPSGHPLDEFMARAVENGLELVRREDITELVTPTLDLASGWLERYVEPTIRLVVERYPALARVGRWVTPGLTQKFEDLKVQVDSEAFARSKQYLVLLFKVPSQ